MSTNSAIAERIFVTIDGTTVATIAATEVAMIRADTTTKIAVKRIPQRATKRPTKVGLFVKQLKLIT